MSLTEILAYQILKIGSHALTVGMLFAVVLIILFSRLLVGLMRRIILRLARKRDLDKGRQQAMEQLMVYLIWVLAVFLILEALGIKPTVILASSAALLVGLGLGLQQIFADVVSGVFLLFEGTIRVGDILEVEGMVGRVEEINLRTSKFRNRDDISMIIPNRMFINERVVNWSHNEEATRFQVSVGVSYGSDVEKVREVLLMVAAGNPEIIHNEPRRQPVVRLVRFGDSSIDFELLFYSRNMFRIESTKSDLRFAIRRALIEHEIEIPFPQHDVHIRSDIRHVKV